MKKGFTLVELLIVVVVLVTLMTIAFRIGGIGEETTKRNRTINRLQRLENCLSGYYAAYGSYPPVKLHGSRDYMLNVDVCKMQCEDSRTDHLEWKSVEAACKSQPLSFCCPFSRKYKDYIGAMSRVKQDTADSESALNIFEALCDNSTVSEWNEAKDWKDAQIFKFGVLSYLLPRYLIAMGGGSSSSDTDSNLFQNQQQWKANNQLPCQFDTGVPYSNWSKVCTDMVDYKWKVAALQSQAACARWLPNLEKTVATMFDTEVYGVQLKTDQDEGASSNAKNLEIHDASVKPGSSRSAGGGIGQPVLLNKYTVVDGWGHEFYYYSLPPHQSYILWSAGPNELTFPHWIVGKELQDVLDKYKEMTDDNGKKHLLQDVLADDIVQMSN